MSNLRPLRFMLTIRGQLIRPLWGLIHDVRPFYSAILENLGPFGIGLNDLRTDAGDGTVGGFGLIFWAPGGGRVRYRVHLMGAEADYLDRGESIELRRADRLTQTLLEVILSCQGGPTFESYHVDCAIHGTVDGVRPAEFVGRFIAKTPEGLNDAMASAAGFRFGGNAGRVSTVEVSVSETVPDSIFVRSQATFDGSQLAPEALQDKAARHFEETLGALGLRLQQHPEEE